jgi:hypothetical protein
MWKITALCLGLLVLGTSCSDDSTGPCNCRDDEKETFTVSSIQPILNSYFTFDRPPDTLYPDRFFAVRADYVNVWRSTTEFFIPNVVTTWGAAWVDSLGDGSGIGMGDDFEFRRFRLLEHDTDFRYVLDPVTDQVMGFQLMDPLFDGEVLAVTYVNEPGDTVGDHFGEPSDDQENPILMELVRPSGALPSGPFAYTWPYMIRSIYTWGVGAIDPASFEVEIHEIANRDSAWRPERSSMPWIQIFGLDQTDDTGTGPPDGKIDLSRNVIDFDRGILVFPCLTPFDPPADLVDVWTDGQFSFTGSYEDLLNPVMYNTPPGTQEYLESSRFNIVFKFYRP